LKTNKVFFESTKDVAQFNYEEMFVMFLV